MTQPYAAWVLARWLAHQELEGRVRPDDMPGHWRELYGVMCATNGGDRSAAFDTYLSHRPDIDRDSVLGHVMAVDPAQEWHEPKAATSLADLTPDVPKLPEVCQPPAALEDQIKRAGCWLDEFTTWANARADRSPTEFNLAGGLFTVSVAVARRLVVRLNHDTYYPNLYFLGIAPTTLYGKSVALDCSADLLEASVPHLLLPREMTSEAMVEELSGRIPLDFENLPQWRRERFEMSRRFAGQRGQLMDEASSLFSNFAKDYMRGLGEMYLLMYDAKRAYERRTQQKGLIVVNDPCLSFYGMTTPAMFREAANDKKHWGSGLWIRFSFLTPTQSPRWTPPRADHSPVPEPLWQPIRSLAESKLPSPDNVGDKPAPALGVSFERDAFESYQRYDQAMFEMLSGPNQPPAELFGTYGRQSAKVIKVATLLAALDWNGIGSPVITLPVWHRAQSIAEGWRVSMHRILAMMSNDGLDDESTRVMALCEASEDGLTEREIRRKTGRSRDYVRTQLQLMTNEGLLEPRLHEGRGPKTIRYHAVPRGETA